MKNVFTVLSLMVLVLTFFPSSSLAQNQNTVQWGWNGGAAQLTGQNITTEVSGVVGDATQASRTISYGIGGLGAVALGALAFFGRFQWGWFFGLVGGLALIGLYNLAVENLAGGGTNLGGLETSN